MCFIYTVICQFASMTIPNVFFVFSVLLLLSSVFFLLFHPLYNKETTEEWIEREEAARSVLHLLSTEMNETSFSLSVFLILFHSFLNVCS